MHPILSLSTALAISLRPDTNHATVHLETIQPETEKKPSDEKPIDIVMVLSRL
jgi:hypothetical protein